MYMALLVLLNLQLECLSSHSWDDIPASELMAYIPELAIGTYGIGIQPFARSLSLDVIKTSCQSETARKELAGRCPDQPANHRPARSTTALRAIATQILGSEAARRCTSTRVATKPGSSIGPKCCRCLYLHIGDIR